MSLNVWQLRLAKKSKQECQRSLQNNDNRHMRNENRRKNCNAKKNWKKLKSLRYCFMFSCAFTCLDVGLDISMLSTIMCTSYGICYLPMMRILLNLSSTRNSLTITNKSIMWSFNFMFLANKRANAFENCCFDVAGDDHVDLERNTKVKRSCDSTIICESCWIDLTVGSRIKKKKSLQKFPQQLKVPILNHNFTKSEENDWNLKTRQCDTAIVSHPSVGRYLSTIEYDGGVFHKFRKQVPRWW